MTVRARRGCGLGGTHGGVALLAALLLIASGLAAGCRAYPRVVESPFAADDEYPQLFWMFTLYDVPADADLPPLGSLAAPNVECMGVASVDELFRSIDACPGARNVLCPALVSEPGACAAVALDTIDKAGASTEKFSIAATGWLDAEELTIEVMLGGDVGDRCATGIRRVGEGGAVVLVCPAAGAPATRALLVVRPKVVRSADDFPVQRAGPRDP